MSLIPCTIIEAQKKWKTHKQKGYAEMWALISGVPHLILAYTKKNPEGKVVFHFLKLTVNGLIKMNPGFITGEDRERWIKTHNSKEK